MNLAVQTIHSYLVHAGRSSRKAPQIRGAPVGLTGKLFDLLEGIYEASEDECDIDIVFNHAVSGAQQNDCRDLIISYLKNPTLPSGRSIAERLELKTDRRSGLGLLFLIAGKEGRNHKLVLSRFPTDSAILADEDQNSLTIEFLERVFMKSKTSYKAVMYSDASLVAGFWQGRAVDKQINAQARENIELLDYRFSGIELQIDTSSRNPTAGSGNARRCQKGRP
jgi:hypothetical protein